MIDPSAVILMLFFLFFILYWIRFDVVLESGRGVLADALAIIRDIDTKWKQICFVTEVRLNRHRLQTELKRFKKKDESDRAEIAALKKRLAKANSNLSFLQEVSQEKIDTNQMLSDALKEREAENKTLKMEKMLLKARLSHSQWRPKTRQQQPTKATGPADADTESALLAKIDSLQRQIKEQRSTTAAAEKKSAQEIEALKDSSSKFELGWNQAKTKTAEAEKKRDAAERNAAAKKKRADEATTKLVELERQLADLNNTTPATTATIATIATIDEPLPVQSTTQSATPSSEIVHENTGLREQLAAERNEKEQILAKVQELEQAVQQRDTTIAGLQANAPLDSAAQSSQKVLNSNLQSELSEKTQQLQQIDASRQEADKRADMFQGYLEKVADLLLPVYVKTQEIEGPEDVPSKVQEFVQQVASTANERDAAIVERNNAVSETDTAIAERTTVINERDTVIGERNAAINERDTAIAERNTATNERDTAIIERDTAISERATVIIDRDTAVLEKDRLLEQIDSQTERIHEYEETDRQYHLQRKERYAENQALMRERDQLKEKAGKFDETTRELEKAKRDIIAEKKKANDEKIRSNDRINQLGKRCNDLQTELERVKREPRDEHEKRLVDALGGNDDETKKRLVEYIKAYNGCQYVIGKQQGEIKMHVANAGKLWQELYRVDPGNMVAQSLNNGGK